MSTILPLFSLLAPFNPNSMKERRRESALRLAILALLMALPIAGCAGFDPINHPIDQVNPETGYRPNDASRHRDAGRIWLLLAFSGGGTRAAAFAYGVLEGVRDTHIEMDGKKSRLIDEVDALTGVSGGSFPAAYYTLFGDRVFDEFEERFLNRNIQRSLFLRALNPWNMIRLMTPYLSRSEMASQYYDKHVFDRATFADLSAAKGPRVHINATDLPSGHNFRFNQGSFDIICSDLDALPVSYAVAASSAVPILLSPLTLKNYAGRCGLEIPEWFEEALRNRETNPRGHRAAMAAKELFDPNEKRYIHLVDGGISDNLGVRMSLDRIAAIGDIETARVLDGAERPHHIVMVIVNAENEPDPLIDLNAKAPSLAASLNLVSGAQIRRYNFESLLLARSSVERFAKDLSRPGNPVTGHVIEVSFDLIKDEDERRYFKRIPTSFSLSDTQVERLREAGRTILTESKAFKKMLEAIK